MINPIDLTFDPGPHVYYWKGKEIPGLSDILKSAGISGNFSNSSELHRFRGTAIHECIRLFNKGTLDHTTVDEEYQPYLSAYQSWLNESKAKPLYSEVMCYDPDLKFACRIDLIAEIINQIHVVEFKTGDPPPSTSIQTAGQSCACKELAPSLSPYDIGRIGLHLKPNGTYKSHQYKDGRDLKVFLSALTCCNWGRNNNHGN